MIPAEDVTFLGGDGGTGKSKIAKQLAVSTVLGRGWMGQSATRGSVLYIGAEDSKDKLIVNSTTSPRQSASDLIG